MPELGKSTVDKDGRGSGRAMDPGNAVEMRALFKGLLVLVAVLVAAFLFFRTPDTDPAEMRAPNTAARPSQFVDLDNGLTLSATKGRAMRRQSSCCTVSADLHTWQEWVRLLARVLRIIRFDQIGHG